jgi:hypothetical protein
LLADGERDDIPGSKPGELERNREHRLVPAETRLSVIMRWEAHVHRILVQTIHELEGPRAARRRPAVVRPILIPSPSADLFLGRIVEVD